jgi:hypothetical protein
VIVLQRVLLWLAGASSAIVFIETEPLRAGDARRRRHFLCDRLANPAAFHAAIIAAVPMLRRGLIVGALIAAIAGIAGYFKLVPGGHDLLTLYERARHLQGPERAGRVPDPSRSVRAAKRRLRRFPKILPQHDCARHYGARDPAGLFPRGMGGLAITSAFMLALMVLSSQSRAQRSRIIAMSVVAVIVVVMLIAVLLSFDSIGEMFKQRASFDQSYDEGRFGRFGRHILGAKMALDLPFGIGPLQFHRYFPEDTHNSYLNAFMSGGWIAGICYPALVFITHGIPASLRPRALATRLSRDLRRVFRHGRRKLHHRHRPLAALLDDAGRRRAALQGQHLGSGTLASGDPHTA